MINVVCEYTFLNHRRDEINDLINNTIEQHNKNYDYT